MLGVVLKVGEGRKDSTGHVQKIGLEASADEPQPSSGSNEVNKGIQSMHTYLGNNGVDRVVKVDVCALEPD